MQGKTTTLREAAQKWLPLSASHPCRVTRFGHTGSGRVPYACIGFERAGKRLSIVFFRHRDGSWYVFPPQR
ncbi:MULTISPECIES: hypothetical protein [unclassified Cupriavidus]|uniref:hypothetical protein n=1 Tax=unclassified Cupriavidus TaxID=2640874 RepID=UPI000290FD17|nr:MULTISPECIES: hypothetical protein [unclassified Cupriavidus]MCD9119428.1 hypothetical protein [Cupriavidus sp. UGS-1]